MDIYLLLSILVLLISIVVGLYFLLRPKVNKLVVVENSAITQKSATTPSITLLLPANTQPMDISVTTTTPATATKPMLVLPTVNSPIQAAAQNATAPQVTGSSVTQSTSTTPILNPSLSLVTTSSPATVGTSTVSSVSTMPQLPVTSPTAKTYPTP